MGKKFMSFWHISIFTILLLLSATSKAGLPPTTLSGQSQATKPTTFTFKTPGNQATQISGVTSLIETGNQNVLVNPNFEGTFSTAPNGWTLANGSAATSTAQIYGTGTQSIAISASSQTATLTQDFTPATGVNFQNVPMEASCKVYTSASNVQVCARTSATNGNCAAAPASSSWQYVPVTFAGPATGNSIGIQVGMSSSGTGSPVFYVKDCYVGPTRTQGTVQQAVLVGQLKITGCAAGWTTSSTSLAAFSAQSGCTYTATAGTSGTAPSTNIPGITFASLRAGYYVLKYEGSLSASSATGTAEYQFWDGTNTALELSYGPTASSTYTGTGSGIQNTIYYSTAQSNVTLSIRGEVTSSSVSAGIYGTTANPGVISVYYFPASFQQAYVPSQAPASWSGYETHSVNWSTTSSTYADPTGGTSAVTQTTNRNFGSVSVAGSGMGISVNFPTTGFYRVCAYAQFEQTTGSSAVASVRLVDGSGTVIDPGRSYYTVASEQQTATTCGTYSVTSISSAITLKVQGAINGSTLSFLNGLATGSSAIQWTIDNGDYPEGMPFIQNNVTSNTTGSERIERIQITATCSSSPCTIASQSGSWVTSVTRIGTGSYVVNFNSGEFSAAPTCSCVNNQGGLRVCSSLVATTSSQNFQTYTNGSSADGSFDAICMGPH